MKQTFLLGGAAILAAFSVASAASANNLDEDGAWQFRSASQTQVLQNGLVLMEERRAISSGAFAASGGGIGGTGLLGSNTSSTNNFSEIINQTTNNCTASAAGADLSCGGGNISGTTVDQKTNKSSSTSTSTISGNTLVNKPTNSNNTGQ